MSATIPATPAYPAPRPTPDLRFGTLVQDGIDLLRKHFLALALPLMILAIATGAGSSPERQAVTSRLADMPENWAVLIPFFAFFGMLAIVVLVALFFLYVLVYYLTARAALEAVDGMTPRPFGERWREAWSRVLPASGACALALLFVVLGLIALVVPGLIVATALLPLSAVIVAEQRGGMDAIRRTWALTRGRRWTLFAIFLVSALVTGVAAAIVGWLPILGGALAGAANGLGSAFMVAVGVIFYRRVAAGVTSP